MSWKAVWKRLTASVLAAGMMLWTPFSAAAAGDPAEPAGEIVLSGEVFTLGQGYFYTPTMVEFYEGESCADILKRAFADAGLEIQYSGEDSTFYLQSVKGADKKFVCLPGYMKDYLADNDVELADNADEWLGERDYTSMSGWMYTVNNEMANVGMGSYYPKSGDVMRVHYTIYGYGADIGFGWGGSADEMADKDKITRLLAEITTSDLDKPVGGSAAGTLFPEAETVGDILTALKKADLETMTPGWLTGAVSDGVTQEAVDAIVKELRAAMGPKEPEPDPEQPVASSDIPEDFENDLWLQYDFKEMKVGDTADIYPRRVPQIVGSATANDVHRPNFHFEILSGDSISLDTADTTDRANVTAEKPGVTIVKVTYDETDYKDVHYGATASTNVAYAVFAVSAADAEDTGIVITPNTEIQPGLGLTSYDTIYFAEGDTVDYAFAPSVEGAETVRVTCNGHVIQEKNGAYTLPLENRSNIIGVTAANGKGVKHYYQVIDARKIQVIVENRTDPGQPIEIGDTAVISFKGIVNPVYKLASIYNPTWYAPDSSWGPTYGTYVEYVNRALSEETFKGICNQWDLAANNDFEVTFEKAGTFTFSDGKIYSEWWGSKLGSDKGVYGQNDPNLSAPVMSRYFCDMPDFTVVVKDPVLEEAKNTAKAELDTYKNPANYDAAGKQALAEIVARGKAAIDAAADAEAVAKALADAKKAMDAVGAGFGEGENPGESLDVSKVLERTLAYIYRNTPAPAIGTVGGEWSVMALAGGEYDVADGYFDEYYDRVVKELQDNGGILEGDRKYTEYSRVIMALSAIGRNAANVGGYDLAEKLTNYEKVTRQGINGSIFALIALDTRGYTTSDPDIRQKYVEDVLSQEIEGGGFSLTGETPDPDITAMAIQSLLPYRSDSRVKAAVSRAVETLSDLQAADGGLGSWGSSNSESIAQTVIALCALEIDPHSDGAFLKNGHSLIDALLTFEAKGGGFMHVKAGNPTGGGAEGGAADGMASDQAALALLAYKRMSSGEPPIYDNSDGAAPAQGNKVREPVRQYPASDGKGIWKQYADGHWELFAEDDSAPLAGWQQVEGNWYHFQENGRMNTGWLKDGGKTYYLKSWGAMQTGWFQAGGKWVYCDSSGALQSRIQPLGKTVYEYPASDGSGIWEKHQDGRWSFSCGDAQAMGWLEIDGTWYFFGSDHAVRTGWQLIDGTWYYLDADGKMNTGWKQINGKWYYFQVWGGMQTGWLKSGADWYFLSADGSMLADAVTPDGYYVGISGQWAD